MDKRILVISNEAFSDASSNGRTMKNLLLGFPKESLAQFYIHGTPDESVCAHYYGVSDSDALRAFLHKKPLSQQKTSTVAADHSGQKPKRSYRNLVLRNMIWQSMRWWTKEFDAFLEDFQPQVVLLQAGDAPFMYKIARKIAIKYGAKLLMFNTENYVLKKRMYAAKPGDSMFWHHILMRSLKRQYRKFMKQAYFCTYSTEYLQQCYQAKYPHPGKSAVFYTGTEMQDCTPLAEKTEHFTLVYCGNLGVGRVFSLCEIAEVLQKIDENARLVIYGRFACEEEQAVLCGCENVDFRGFVAYDEIPQVLAKAAMVIHCENPQRLEDLKTAFSTKIADSLACGKPFLVYASREYPFVQYLEQNESAHIAENKEELEAVLRNCIKDTNYAERFVCNAKQLAAKNHNAQRNSQRVMQIVSD